MLGAVGEARVRSRSDRPQTAKKRALLAALAIALALVAVAAVGLGLGAHRAYQEELTETYELEAQGARLLAAGLAEEGVQSRRVRGADAARRRAQADFASQARRVLGLAQSDRPSARLVRDQVAAQLRARQAARADLSGRGRQALALLDMRSASRGLAQRQRTRRVAARDRLRRRSVLAIAAAGAAGALALAAAWRRPPREAPR